MQEGHLSLMRASRRLGASALAGQSKRTPLCPMGRTSLARFLLMQA